MLAIRDNLTELIICILIRVFSIKLKSTGKECTNTYGVETEAREYYLEVLLTPI